MIMPKSQIIAILMLVAVTCITFTHTSPARAQGFDKLYDKQILVKDEPRFRKAIGKIFKLGIIPVLRPKEKKALQNIEFQFPYPKQDDYILNFYAYRDGGRLVVVMPLLSLKMLEDLTTAYAWLHHNKYTYNTIEHYFTMLRYRKVGRFPNARYPMILDALGIPKDALKNPKVDELSLSLRNEAFAFILIHELGHIYFRHRGYNEITTAEARADEMQSDRFALEVLERTRTGPLGAALFFQAQVYSMPHRGEFKTDQQWQAYLHKHATHPLSTERIREMARYISGPLANNRPANEKYLWVGISELFTKVIKIIEDKDLQQCMAQIARKAPLDILKPQRSIAIEAMTKYCRG